MADEPLTFYIVANAASGPGLSGGDRISIELIRRWTGKGYPINIFVWEEGYEMYERNNLKAVNYILCPAQKYKKFGPIIFYLARTIIGCRKALSIRLPEETDKVFIYSASEFWMDALPGWVLKKRLPGAKWITPFYLFAPIPFKGFRGSYKKGWRWPRMNDLYYFLLQRPMYHLILRRADIIFVTNELDRQHFIKKGISPQRVITVRGGVDTKISSSIPEQEKRYEAVFVGRLHPQKGALELIDIWERVCRVKKNAKLAIIGEGPLEEKIKQKIKGKALEKNINLLGFMDGIEKIRIFKSSNIVLHPAVYDSGGMAACEAMACGLPGVSFDLPALKTYYPKGILKTPIGDTETFASNIIKLLTDNELYQKESAKALALAREEWDWDRRAEEILKILKQIIG